MIATSAAWPRRARVSVSLAFGPNRKYAAMATSSTGTKPVRKDGSTTCSASAPPTEPANEATTGHRKRRKSISLRRAKVTTALVVPKLDCTLLVAIASTGGTPASSSAGMAISPPPPAMASVRSAMKAAIASSARTASPNSMVVLRQWKRRAHRRRRKQRGQDEPALAGISWRWRLPHHLGHRAVQPRTDAQQGDAVALFQAPLLAQLAEHDRHRSRADVAVLAEDGHDLLRVDAHGPGEGLGVGLADLVDDELVQLADHPAQLLAGDLEGLLGQLHALDQQGAGIGDHAVQVAPAQLVPLGGRAGDAAAVARRARSQFGAGHHHGGGARTQGEGGQLVAEIFGGDVGAG